MLKLEYFAKSTNECEYARGLMTHILLLGLNVEFRRVGKLVEIKFKTENRIHIIYEPDINVIHTVDIFCRAYEFTRDDINLRNYIKEVENIGF